MSAEALADDLFGANAPEEAQQPVQEIPAVAGPSSPQAPAMSPVNGDEEGSEVGDDLVSHPATSRLREC